MKRANLKLRPETKTQLDAIKHDDETWDECLRRLIQLEKATRL